MSGFRDKMQVFFLGLMLGLLIGGGFFILKLDNYFKELSFYKSLYNEDEDAQEPQEQAKKNEEPGQKKNAKNAPVTVTKKTLRDTAAIKKTDKPLKSDTLAILADSLPAAAKLSPEGEIVVKKDEMTGAQTIEVINLDLSANAGKNPKDSLLQQVSGVRDDARPGFRVEFWRSPLNYKGYKMTRSKIVLYGISSSDPVSIFKLEDDYYMKHLNTVYRLSLSGEFRQFEKVNDAGILARLNK